MAAQMARLRDPNLLAAAGITEEISRMPIGIIAELMPIIRSDTPLDSRIRDKSGNDIPKVRPKTVIAEQAATRLRTLILSSVATTITGHLELEI